MSGLLVGNLHSCGHISHKDYVSLQSSRFSRSLEVIHLCDVSVGMIPVIRASERESVEIATVLTSLSQY